MPVFLARIGSELTNTPAEMFSYLWIVHKTRSGMCAKLAVPLCPPPHLHVAKHQNTILSLVHPSRKQWRENPIICSYGLISSKHLEAVF